MQRISWVRGAATATAVVVVVVVVVVVGVFSIPKWNL
jgi:hypothetical protein